VRRRFTFCKLSENMLRKIGKRIFSSSIILRRRCALLHFTSEDRNNTFEVCRVRRKIPLLNLLIEDENSIFEILI